ncbi:MAG: hypothetical protein JSV05_07115 [Candidatus Bathyarchaeota archaeon]|nr:MAG: hypothetical protein JSV05_07115 [Candidatus Bathyarchaeota archaeon]
MPKLKLKVELALHRYLTNELVDEEFIREIQAILNEFQGKNLLHQNIGQLIWNLEIKRPNDKAKFEKIWLLLDRINPRIREDLSHRLKSGPWRRAT